MNHINIRNFERNNLDFNVVQYGYRKCAPCFSEKPHIWQNVLIHYVYDGSGVLISDGIKYPVSKNQAFVIFPGQIAHYIADSQTPFTYRWIEFYGNSVKLILTTPLVSPKNPVIDDPKGIIGEKLSDIVNGGEMSNALLLSKFWAFADTLITDNTTFSNHTDMYIEKAISYIGENISSPTTVYDVCHHLNISRNYFSAIFTEKMEISPKRYILDCHMNMAKELLKRSDYSVSEIAGIVGYDLQSKFTKAFTRYEGVSPSQYRKKTTAQ